MTENVSEFITRLSKVTLSCDKDLMDLTTYDEYILWNVIKPIIINNINKRTNKKQLSRKIKFILYKCALPFIIIFNICIYLFIKLLYYIKGYLKNNSNSKIIAFYLQNVEWRAKTDVYLQNNGNTDVFFDDVFFELKHREFHTIGFSNISIHFGKSILILLDRMKKSPIHYYPIDLFYNTKALYHHIMSYKYYINSWKLLKMDKKFKEFCNTYDDKIYDYILDELYKYFTVVFPYLIKEACQFSNFIDQLTPSAVIMQNEYGWLEKTYLVAAKKKGVPVIAIQHGVIHEDHAGYLIDINHLKNNTMKDVYLPNQTAVLENITINY